MNRSLKSGITTLAILCSFAISSFADTFVEIAPSAARQVCENFLLESQAQTKGIDSVEMIRNRDLVVGYCFHLSPEGTVIVPAHKGLDPVLFFGEQGRLDLADTFGPGETFRSILSERGSHGNHASWDHYLADTKLFKAGIASQSAQKSLVGGPLLTTAWHQHAPFNNLCPERPDGYNAKVGCVPLAVAQIMNYHEWPNGGLGSRTKSGWYSPITADFTVPFDWNDMPDNCGLYAGDQGDQTNSCNVAESAAVARFCRDIGIAMDVIYGDGVGGNVGSSAVYSKVIEVLPWYFRYDDTIKQGASSTYTAAELFDLIRSEVDANRPILYSIGKTVGEEDFGHAVVVDGYSDRGGSYRYHVNFGNGPAGNGWWAIGSLPNDWQDRNFWYDIKPQDYLFVGPVRSALLRSHHDPGCDQRIGRRPDHQIARQW